MADPASRVLRPARPLLARALAVVTGLGDEVTIQWAASSLTWPGPPGLEPYAAYLLSEWPSRVRNELAEPITDPREAWEALVTRLDLEGWVDGRRRFAVPYTFEDTMARVERERTSISRASDDLAARVSPHPPTLEACVAIASDPRGIQTAEELAREITGRERFVWRVVPAADTTRYCISTAELWRLLGHPAAPKGRLLAAHGDLRRAGYAIDGVILHGMTDEACVLVCPGLST